MTGVQTCALPILVSVNEFAELEVPGPYTGLEEEGVGGEAWVGTLLGHEIEGRDCFV